MALLQLSLMKARNGLNNFLRKITITPIRHSSRTETPSPIMEDQDDELNQPIKYSSSPAATWAAKHSFSGENGDAPWFQGHVVSVSVASFLIYFLYLREENDIDKIFERDLTDHFGSTNAEALRKKIEENSQQAYRKV